MADGVVRVGISGWRYPPWRGVFYPEGLPQRSELGYASRRFGTIELSGSFYSLQRPESYARWYGETPPDFVFSVKGPRFVTHMLKLRDVDVALANFFASGIASLYESGYTKVALARWARRIRRWRDGVEPSDARRRRAERCATKRALATSVAAVARCLLLFRQRFEGEGTARR